MRHGALVFVASMLVNVCGYLYHAGTSRILGVEEYGTLYALISILPIAGIPAGILSTVIVKFAAEFRALQDESHLHALIVRLTLWIGALAGIVIVVATIFQKAIGTFLNVPARLIVPTAVLIGIILLLPSLRAVLQGTQDFIQFAISASIEGVFKAAMGITLALTGARLFGAISGFALGSFCALIYTWAILQKRYGKVQSAPLRIDWRRVLQTLWGAGVLTITMSLLSNADVLMVKHFMSPTQAGLYAAASLGGKILLFVVGFVPLVLLPKAADRNTRGQNPIPSLLSALGALAAFSVVGLALFFYAPTLVLHSLVGTQFFAASRLLFQYGLAMVFLAAMVLVANYKIALHRFDFAIPFIVVTIGELAAIFYYHPSLSAVIITLVLGNAAGFASSLYRVGSWSGSAAP